jgi:hypothetical protein
VSLWEGEREEEMGMGMGMGMILQTLEDMGTWRWAYRADPHAPGAPRQDLPVDQLLGLGILDLHRVKVNVTLHPFANEDIIHRERHRGSEFTGDTGIRQATGGRNGSYLYGVVDVREGDTAARHVHGRGLDKFHAVGRREMKSRPALLNVAACVISV